MHLNPSSLNNNYQLNDKKSLTCDQTTLKCVDFVPALITLKQRHQTSGQETQKPSEYSNECNKFNKLPQAKESKKSTPKLK